MTRPRPKRAQEYFRELIRGARAGQELGANAELGKGTRLGAEGHLPGGGPPLLGDKAQLVAPRSPFGEQCEGDDQPPGRPPPLQEQEQGQPREQQRGQQWGQGQGQEQPCGGQGQKMQSPTAHGSAGRRLGDEEERQRWRERLPPHPPPQRWRERLPPHGQWEPAPQAPEPVLPSSTAAASTSSSAWVPNSSSTPNSTASTRGPSTASAASSDIAGLRRRRKLFPDSVDGPHPRTTARIVARLAACRNWRRQLAQRLLPRYLPLFDQHAAAYFFKHVPSLQPHDPQVRTIATSPASAAMASVVGSVLPREYDGVLRGPYEEPRRSAAAGGGPPAPSSSFSSSPLSPSSSLSSASAGPSLDAAGFTAAAREAADFRRMVLAVCCSLLPKLGSFGPRALCLMAAGLGRMGISHEATLAAWEARSLSQLGLMRPDQLVSSLEGLAALQPLRDRQRAKFKNKKSQKRQEGGPVVAAAAMEEEQQEEERMLMNKDQKDRRSRGSIWGSAPRQELGPAQGQPQEQGQVTEAEAEAEGMVPEDAEGPPPDPAWRAAALVAAWAALPGMRVGEVGRLLQAIAVLRLAPPPELLDAACERVRQGVAEEAAELGVGAGTAVAAHNGGAGSAGGDERALLSVARALAEAVASSSPTISTGIQLSATGKHAGMGVVAAAAAAATKMKPRRVKRRAAAVGAVAQREAKLTRQPAPPPPPEPLRGGDISRVLLGLAALRHAPPPDWLSWLVGSCRSVVREQLEDRRRRRRLSQPPKKWQQRAAGRTWVAATASASAHDLAAPGGGGSTAAAGAAAAGPAVSFFTATDLGELAAAVGELLPLLAPAVPPTPPALNGGGGDGGGDTGASLPSPMPREWLDLLCEAALEDMKAQLDPAAAAAAAAAEAAAANPVAVLTQGDVRKVDGGAAATLAGTVTAAAAAAARVVPAASLLLVALLRLSPSYRPPHSWCVAAAEMGLELVPYMPPAALLLWLRSLAAWGSPRPPPLAWHAAAAVSSRANLTSYTVRQVCELPGAMTAAGIQLPATWAAAYLRHLAARLHSEDVVQALISTPPARDVLTAPSPGRLHPAAAGAWSQQRGPDRRAWQIARCRSVRVNKSGRGAGMRHRSFRQSRQKGERTESLGRAAAVMPLLDDVAAALGWLPYVVQDLHYVAKCESAALQALALALQVSLEPPAHAGTAAAAATATLMTGTTPNSDAVSNCVSPPSVSAAAAGTRTDTCAAGKASADPRAAAGAGAHVPAPVHTAPQDTTWSAAEAGARLLPDEPHQPLLPVAPTDNVVQQGTAEGVGRRSAAGKAPTSGPASGPQSGSGLLLASNETGVQVGTAAAVWVEAAAAHRRVEAVEGVEADEWGGSNEAASPTATAPVGSEGPWTKRRRAGKTAGSAPPEAGVASPAGEIEAPGVGAAAGTVLRQEVIKVVEAFFVAAGFPHARCAAPLPTAAAAAAKGVARRREGVDAGREG